MTKQELQADKRQTVFGCLITFSLAFILVAAGAITGIMFYKIFYL
ncbi:hypothetical protein PQ459_10175 [Chryseobacterium sp. KACC 21268]|nr:hypothetical protein PQ459_10175 [Chryseobacterium sp. KACC 21268]